ncbi:hypothetical protein BH23BAC1_BH23BAC1_27620 [soil metagenome]
MKKDIPFYPVQNVMLAVVRQENEKNDKEWRVYLLNKNEKTLKNVMVTSKGYGVKNGVKQETSVLRHYLGEILPHQHVEIEPIDPALFHLFNEYWISYYIENQIYDKKFVFVPESIAEENLIMIKQLNLEGVLHT